MAYIEQNIIKNQSFKLSNERKIIICEGDSIFLAGNYQKKSGIYIDNLEIPNNSKSIITTTLEVKSNFPNKNNIIKNKSIIDWKKPIRFNSTLYVDKKN